MSEGLDVQPAPEDALTAQPEGQDTTQTPGVESAPEGDAEPQHKFAGGYPTVEALETGHRNMQADYTRKCQENADRGRRIEELEDQISRTSQPEPVAPEVSEDEETHRRAVTEYGEDSVEARNAKRNLEIGRDVAAQKNAVARTADEDYRAYVGKVFADTPELESDEGVKNKFYADLKVRFAPYGGIEGLQAAIKNGTAGPESVAFAKDSIAAAAAAAKPVVTAAAPTAADIAASRMAGGLPPSSGEAPAPAPTKRDYFTAREEAKLKRRT